MTMNRCEQRQSLITTALVCGLLFVLTAVAIDQRLPASPRPAPPTASTSPALREFLRRFDPVARQGFVRTRRAGPTGIGYTLETLLGIRENNSPRGDLLGMEIKAYRDDEDAFDDRHKMNLFLKEPTWNDSAKAADRIRRFGYTDDQGRPAWYQSVTCHRNSSGLSLAVDAEQRRVQLKRRRRVIGYWSFDVLQQRLSEKLNETVFVAAATKGSGKDEHFHFRTVTYCAGPSVDRLIELIEAGDVIVELRMHVKESGAARNHGTAFRLRKHRLIDLFAEQQRCRPVNAAASDPCSRPSRTADSKVDAADDE